MVLPYDGRSPRIPDEFFVAPGADVIGDVRLGERTSVWFGAVVPLLAVRLPVPLSCHVWLTSLTIFSVIQ